MPKYQLTERQKDILRTASRGLRKGEVGSTWSWITMPSDNGAGRALVITDGFDAAAELKVSIADLREFEEQGFLKSIEGRNAYHVKEQKIHDAVDSDFEIPDHIATSAKVEAHFHGNVSSSNINIAQNMENIAQTLQSSEFLSSDTKADIQYKIAELQQELKDFEESHSKEIREVTRSLNILMEDLVDSEPDRLNLAEALARLRRAGGKLLFAPVALERLGEIIEMIQPYISG